MAGPARGPARPRPPHAQGCPPAPRPRPGTHSGPVPSSRPPPMADPGPRPHHAPSPPALAARLGHAASRSRSSARLLHSFPRPPAPLRASRRIMSIFLSSCSFRSHQSSACPPHAAGLPGWSVSICYPSIKDEDCLYHFDYLF
ncbi:cx9C motif-containing protein 4 isoform X4 [Oenanthe melanoleuca]|uniref:cx9C motif-containing protein 4 isoform X4 n=1 Tax=Oenanthe melanoleuca TaxID=2939378 RepID=UPI0024C13F77|nr:cx9C motif-containing protein 4 isoform X4 [Oenanthe melanoleuca]